MLVLFLASPPMQDPRYLEFQMSIFFISGQNVANTSQVPLHLQLAGFISYLGGHADHQGWGMSEAGHPTRSMEA